jgi:hypothetical protein
VLESKELIMEELLTIENLLIAVIVLLVYIVVLMNGILGKLAEIREETGLFKVQFIPRDKW